MLRKGDRVLREWGKVMRRRGIGRRVANVRPIAVIGGALTACYTSRSLPALDCYWRQGSPAEATRLYGEAQSRAKCPSTF